MLPSDIEVATDPLRLRLDFHGEAVLLHDYGDAATTTRMVSALAVAHALASELDMSTGILPPETLWFTKTANGAHTAIWRGPRIWNVQVRLDYEHPAEKLKLPMPGLVFICTPGAQSPYVFAAVKRPESADEQLFKCPTFNVFSNGRVCPGNHRFPTDPTRIPEDFFKSFFSTTGDSHGRSRKHPRDLLSLWRELDNAKTYPLDDLQPALDVVDAFKIGE